MNNLPINKFTLRLHKCNGLYLPSQVTDRIMEIWKQHFDIFEQALAVTEITT